MLYLYNSLTRQKEQFVPIDPTRIRMYVCGPTVYDRAHIGNARAVVVYDVLYRLLVNGGWWMVNGQPPTTNHQPPVITYARNITDVDDKINARAKERGITIQALTQEVTQWFHDDMDALNNLRPTLEPRATQHIADIIALIEKIHANGHAYVSAGHVLFDVAAFTSHQPLATNHYSYGNLSGKKLEDLIAGARVEVESYKRNPADFVLWKPADAEDDASSVFDSPWGKGRPGWHIECSAMSNTCLGENFDIHGGGADLKFPHHENEIAQSLAAHPQSHYAKYWVHNGFVTVNGEKMSKSLGNFITVRDLLDKGWRGEEIRFVLLATHYRKPLDFNDKALEDARKVLERLYAVVTPSHDGVRMPSCDGMTDSEFLSALDDDLNTPKAIARLLELAKAGDVEQVKECASLLGVLEYPQAFTKTSTIVDTAKIQSLIAARAAAKAAKNWAEADRIRDELTAMGVTLKDNKDGTVEWYVP